MPRTRSRTLATEPMFNFDGTGERSLASFDVLEYKLAGIKILIDKLVQCVQRTSDSILDEEREVRSIYQIGEDGPVGGCAVIKQGSHFPLTSRCNLERFGQATGSHSYVFDKPGDTTFGYRIHKGMVTSIEELSPKPTSVPAGKFSFLLKEIRQAAERSGNGRCQVRFDITDGGSFRISLLPGDEESLSEDIRRLFWSNGRNGKDRDGVTGNLSGSQQTPLKSALKQDQAES